MAMEDDAGIESLVQGLLARHSTIALTMDRYTHALPEQSVRAVTSLPNLNLPPESKALKPTGTEGAGSAAD